MTAHDDIADARASFAKLRSAGRTSDILKVWCDDGTDALDRVEAELSRLREVEESFKHLSSEYQFDMDRGDHLVYREEWERFDRWQRLRDTLEEVDFVGAEGFAADMVAAAQAEASRLREQRARCARLQRALREIAEIDERDDSRPTFFGLQNAFFKAQRIAREALAGPDTPADRRCPELNPNSTFEDRCERPVGHSGDHVSVCHFGRMKVYPSKWDTPADSQESGT